MGRVIFVLFFTFAVAFCKPTSEDAKAELLKFHEECAVTSGVDAKDILDKEFDDIGDEDQVKTHVLCIGQKLKIIDDDNKIDREVLKTHLGEIITEDGKVDEIVTKCAEEKDDARETAYSMTKCIHEIMREN